MPRLRPGRATDQSSINSHERADLGADGRSTIGGRYVLSPLARIAVVERDPDNRALLVAMLEQRYDVIACAGLADALVAIPDHQPHVVLWDVGLGDDGSAGTAVRERLQRDPRLSSTSSIAITASVRPDAERTWLWRGFDAFVAKPIVDKRDLWHIIDDLCGVAAGAPAPVRR